MVSSNEFHFLSAFCSLEVCAEGREGYSCGQCTPGWTPLRGQGACIPCEQKDVFPLILASVLLLVVILGLYPMVTADRLRSPFVSAWCVTREMDVRAARYRHSRSSSRKAITYIRLRD